MPENKIPKPDNRLSLAASFVRHGAVAADIGTDHAYIPIYLLLSGTVNFAVASDINEGPLKRAQSNARRYGVDAKMLFYRADGLSGLPLEENKVTDITVCGMGGELIYSIINESEYAKKENVQLILQPMSAVTQLRRGLSESGFDIINEGITEAGGKLYQCILCRYDGLTRQYSPAELLLGRENIRTGTENPYFAPLLCKSVRETEKIIAGMKAGGLDTYKENALLTELYHIAKDKGINL